MLIDRRKFISGLAMTPFVSPMLTLPFSRPATAADATIDPAIRALYERSLVIDSLGLGYEWDKDEYAAVEASGFTGIQTSLANRNFEVASAAIAEWRRRISANPDKLRLATTAEDFRAAKEAGQLAVMLGFQNGRIFEDEVDNVDALYFMGTRCVQLTYNFRNLIGNGCLERVDGGLSDFGMDVVKRMNELGMIVDLSHCGYQTTLDGVAYSEGPVAYTHTMCEAVYPGHPRAKTDDQLRALADKGGVVGIVSLGYFVGPDPGGETGVDDYLDHIIHAMDVAGAEHVGLASDYAIRGISSWATRESWYEPRLSVFKPSYNLRWPPWIPELDKPDRFLIAADGMARRGLSEDTIEGILGGNWLRLFETVLRG